MQISEAKVSAVAVSLLTGAALAFILNSATGDIGMALMVAVPAALVMGAVLALFASDDVKKGGGKPPAKQAPERANEGK